MYASKILGHDAEMGLWEFEMLALERASFP